MSSPPSPCEPEQTAAHIPGVDHSTTCDVTGAFESTGNNASGSPESADDAPVIPGYTISYAIAKGGMGRIFAGHDRTLDREVAIKTLLPGANADRFVTEAKVTAKLPHPGIPPVYALGMLDGGAPWLAMKLIRGRTLADLLLARATPVDDLPRHVQIFEQIAQAAGFAHSRGIIHRDLKPLNVMVGEFGEVQVMDWGLAKELSNREETVAGDPSAGDASDDVDHTAAGAVMGTPGYMAPEQARGEAVDSRTDVFALGSILAAILTGKPAFIGSTARETIGKAAAADLEDVRTRLAGCGGEPDLVALALRSLAPAAADRPADARAVADQVAAHRSSVEARLRRAETDAAEARVREAEQRKRRRVLQWAGGIVAAVLVLGISGTTFGLIEARVQEKEARKQEDLAKIEAAAREEARKGEAARADGELRAKIQAEREKSVALAVRDFLQKRLIRQASPYEHARRAFADRGDERRNAGAATRDPTVRELLDRASDEFSPEKIARIFPDQPQVQAEVLETIGETYEGLKEFEKAVRFVEAAQAVRQNHLGSTHPITLAGHTNLTFSYLAAGRPVATMRSLTSLLGHLESFFGQLPDDPVAARDHPAMVQVDAILSRIEERANPHSFAYPNLKLSLEDAASLALAIPPLIARTDRLAGEAGRRFGKDDRRTLVVELIAAFGHHAIGKGEKVVVAYESILARAERSLGPDDRVLDGLREILIATYEDLKFKLPEATRLLEQAHAARLRALGEQHPNTLTIQSKLAKAYQAAHRYEEAIGLLGRLLAIHVQRDGADHPESLENAASLADAHLAAGRHADAQRMFAEVHQSWKRKHGGDHLETIDALSDLAHAHKTAKDWSRAESLYEDLLRLRKAKQGTDHASTVNAMVRLADVLLQQNELARSLKLYEEAVRLRKSGQGADNPATLTTMNDLGTALVESKQFSRAAEVYEETLKRRRERLGPDDKQTLITAGNLALVYRDQKRFDRAVPLFEDTVRRIRTNLGSDNEDLAYTLHAFGICQRESGELDKAVPLFQEALALRKKNLGVHHASTTATNVQFALLYKRTGEHAKAIPLLEDALEATRLRRGPDHPDTLLSLNNLAVTCANVGQSDRARTLYETALQGVERTRFRERGASLIVNNAMRELEGAKLFEKAESWRRKWTEAAKKQSGADSIEYAVELSALGVNLLAQEKWTDAETALRDCLAIRRKAQPDSWTTFNTLSLLGGVLLGRKKHAEAEMLLAAGWEGMLAREKFIPPAARPRLREAVDRLIDLHTATGKAEEVKKYTELRSKLPATAPSKP